MPRTVSATEAKNRLGSIIDWVLKMHDEVIVESRGEPKVVVMPFSEYEKVQVIKEALRRREALDQLERLRERVARRNEDLTEDEAEALADRFVREVLDDMGREGKVQFEA